MVKGKRFDLIPHRILTHKDKLKRIYRGERVAPIMGIFHPTYACNHNCPGCDFREENKKYKKILSKEESEHIINELVFLGVKGIEFSGGGEPLIDKNTAYNIRKLKDKDISTGVLTNGSFFSGDIQKAIIENSSYIRISLESGSNEGFKKAKGINDNKEFPKIIENIKRGINLREKTGSEIDISIKYTIGAHNYQDIENAVLLAIDLGVDSIQFKSYQNVDSVELIKDSTKNLEGKVGTITKTKMDLKRIKETYDGKNTRIIGNLEKTPLKKRCWLSPLITVIDALGDVYLCSYYRHRQKTHKIGNLLPNKSFNEIWYSDKHIKAIKNTKIEECNKYDCRFHEYNEIAEKIIKDEAFTRFI
jgi:radical SAM protein with 4Fe4S-binding SPASM domain